MAEFANLQFGPMPAMRPLLKGKRETELLESMWVDWHGIALGALIIPAGFVHDGPSVPGRLRGVTVYTHRQLRASIAHDYIYAEKPEGWTRAMADKLFLAGLEADGVGWLKRRLMYSAVRAGGGFAWRT